MTRPQTYHGFYGEPESFSTTPYDKPDASGGMGAGFYDVRTGKSKLGFELIFELIGSDEAVFPHVQNQKTSLDKGRP